MIFAHQLHRTHRSTASTIHRLKSTWRTTRPITSNFHPSINCCYQIPPNSIRPGNRVLSSSCPISTHHLSARCYSTANTANLTTDSAATNQFQLLSSRLQQETASLLGDRWPQAVRTLIEMKHLSMDSTTMTVDAALTREHFHDVFRTILNRCRVNTPLIYPNSMTAAEFSEELLTCCIGTSVARDDQHGSFQPDLVFYSKLIDRLDDCFKLRDATFNGPTESHPIAKSNESLSLLVMAIEAERTKSNDIPTRSDSLSPLPSLTLVRHLFLGLIEADLVPSRETINYILAIFDAHRYSQTNCESPSSSSSSSLDLDYIWQLWTNMSRLYHVHPDLLSRVLILRICYQHQQFSYMARILSQYEGTKAILTAVQPILTNHKFAEPHLILDALTHSSKVSSRLDSNERMEFLGDSVLDILIRELVIEQLTQRSQLASAAGSDSSISSPSAIFQNQLDLLPIEIIAQIKGKHVSHRIISKLSRQIGLTDLLLQANRDVRSSMVGWQEQSRHRQSVTAAATTTVPTDRSMLSIRAKRKFPLQRAWDTSQPTQVDVTHQPVPDNLAEDVFEACLAALFLDLPNNKPAISPSPQTEPLNTPDLPMATGGTSINQAYGISAVRDFLRPLMGESISSACTEAQRIHQQHRLKHGDRQHIRASNIRNNKDSKSKLRMVFDSRINYKKLLDLYIRSIFTDDDDRCLAHLLYTSQGVVGGHTYRSSVILKVLPGGEQYHHILCFRNPSPRSPSHSLNNSQANAMETSPISSPELIDQANTMDYLSLLERREYERELQLFTPDPVAANIDSVSVASSSALPGRAVSSCISFSVASTSRLPRLTAYDYEFPFAIETPESTSAEQKAAFFALHELNVLQ